MTFHIIDKRTGKEPIYDHNHLFKEKWFKESGLIYCDIDGWYIGEDGTIILVDECGRVAYPPIDRFEVVEDKPQGEWIMHYNDIVHAECSNCKTWFLRDYMTRSSFCPNCGCRMGEPQESEDI